MRTKSISRVFFALCFFASGCNAFMLGSTRVILPQDSGSAALIVINDKQDPLSLIRSKITKTTSDEEPVKNFVVTPPLFRLDAGARSQVRVALVNPQGLPVDRESMFYLKVAAIPASNPLARNSQGGFSGGSLHIATGNIIKLFYRPHGISAPDGGSWKALRYSRVPGGVLVSNPTPWHVSFVSLVVDGKSVTFGASQPSVLPPFGKQIYGTRSTLKKQMKWSLLNDDGSVISDTSTIE